MRVKKRVKRKVKKGIKRVKAAPPEAYLAGAGVLVGAAAVVLLATTKSGRELLIRTAQLTLSPEADEPKSQEPDVAEADEQQSQESDAREDVDNEPAEDAEGEVAWRGGARWEGAPSGCPSCAGAERSWRWR